MSPTQDANGVANRSAEFTEEEIEILEEAFEEYVRSWYKFQGAVRRQNDGEISDKARKNIITEQEKAKRVLEKIKEQVVGLE